MSLPSAQTVGTRQRRRQRSSAVDSCFSLPSAAVGPRKMLCRVPDNWPSAKSLFAVKFFSEGSLPRTVLGKAFVESFWAFTECPGPSIKRTPPVVNPLNLSRLLFCTCLLLGTCEQMAHPSSFSVLTETPHRWLHHGRRAATTPPVKLPT